MASLRLPAALVASFALLAPGCGEPDDGALPRLSQYQLFTDLKAQRPAAGVVPYDVIAQLYADNAGKLRFLQLPRSAGGAVLPIRFSASEPWQFPDGTVIAKTFFVLADARQPAGARRLIETRLLVKRAGEWLPYTYLWNAAESDAEKFAPGASRPTPRINEQGVAETLDYQIPSTAQCKHCHGQNKQNVPLGPRTRQLNRGFDQGQGEVNQIADFAARGLFDIAPPAPETLDRLQDFRVPGSVEGRARSYLDANCAHCHNAIGFAASTNLQLNRETSAAVDLGLCRRPVAAGPASGGLLFDIVPGHPEQSILVHRMRNNSDPKTKMPPLPLTTVDTLGVEVVSAWIKGLGGDCK